MSVLIDTHVLLWLLAGERGRFGRDAVQALRARTAVISAATVWEISIKRRTGKLDAPANLLELVAAAGLQLLSITAGHAERVADLPDVHGDPFDRLLVAQAMLEHLTILTADANIGRYGVATLDPAS